LKASVSTCGAAAWGVDILWGEGVQFCGAAG
jgi:hypothetical protein